jgi:hypothetical protein
MFMSKFDRNQVTSALHDLHDTYGSGIFQYLYYDTSYGNKYTNNGIGYYCVRINSYTLKYYKFTVARNNAGMLVVRMHNRQRTTTNY